MANKRHTKKQTTPPAARPGLFDRLADHRTALLVTILVVSAAAAVLMFDPKLSTGGDDAVYITLSQSLYQGRGYHDLYTPGEPAHQQYPFGYPLLLAAVRPLGRQPLIGFKLLSLLASLAAVWLTWQILRLINPGATGQVVGLSAGLALLAGLNPSWLEFSHWVLTEIPYTCATLLGMLLLLKSKPGTRQGLALVALSAVVICFSYYIRPNGVTLMAAAVLSLLWQRRFKEAALFCGLTILLMLPWTLYNRQQGGGLGKSVEIFLTKDVYNLDAGRLSFTDMLDRIAENWGIYLGSVLPAMLAPLAAGMWYGLRAGGSYLVAAVCSLLIILGLVREMRTRRIQVTGMYLILFLLLAFIWHPTVSSERYLIPVYPILCYYLFTGLQSAAGSFSPEKARATAVVLLVGMLCLLNAFTLLPRIADNISILSAYRDGDRLAGYEPNWRSFYEAAQWVKDNTPPQSVVVSRKPSLFYMAAERKAYCYPFTADRDSVLRTLRHADYVMVEPVSGTLQKYLLPVVQPAIGRQFTIVHAAGVESGYGTYVLQVQKEQP